MARTIYDLLSVNVISSWRSRTFFKREKSENSYDVNLENGRADLKKQLRDLISKGIQFKNCIFTGHGNSGIIWLGADYITREIWYKEFYRQGFERLFPFPNAKLYFAGCNVAEGQDGWRFLEAAARSMLTMAGGVAMGWTSTGFGSPFSGHERHLWGDTREVSVFAGGDSLRFYENWNLITDADNMPTRPE
jgi:hypothetical protein